LIVRCGQLLMEARPIAGQATEETTAPRSARLDILIVVSPFIGPFGHFFSSDLALRHFLPSGLIFISTDDAVRGCG
jgi:hypothetical protein